MTTAINPIQVPPFMEPFMERHGADAAATITSFLTRINGLDEKLGALGVLALVMTATGDSLCAMQQAATAADRKETRQ